MMPKDEQQQVAFAGLLIFEWICTMIFSCGLTGVYILAFAISMHIMMGRRNTGQPYKTMMLVLWVGFLLQILWFCMEVTSKLVTVNVGLVESLPGGLLEQEAVSNSKPIITIGNIIQICCQNFTASIADAVIVWRAWALRMESHIIRWTLVTIVLLNLGVDLANLICSAKDNATLDHKSENAKSTQIDDITLNWIGYFLELSVNITATLIITHRAWTHRKWKAVLICCNKKTQVGATLAVLIESGAVFGVIQVFIVVLSILDVHSLEFSSINDANSYFVTLLQISSVLNPVAVIILVQTKNSHKDSFHLEVDL